MKDFLQYTTGNPIATVFSAGSLVGNRKVRVKSLGPVTLFILLMVGWLQTHAQVVFPVQVNQSILPPYNTRLNSYVTSTDVKLRLYLTLTDINVSNRQVRLKLRIQGEGLDIRSTDFVTGAAPIFLNGGTQRQFTNVDLAPYFQLNNLLGISPDQYNRPLPEGSYRICWEVYDFLTGQRISAPNTGCSSVFLVLNAPPFLNLPNNGDQLTDVQPINIIFQWTPRHANATNVSYEFELRELWDNNIDPQAGFFAATPYHTETTSSTTLLYNMGKPILIPGRNYAWRVRARSITGLSENSVFRNNGHSEIFYFTYTNQCFPPTFTLAEPLDKGRVKISWQTHPDHNRYHVQYRRSDIPDAQWFQVFSYNNQVQVANLQDGVTYSFRVGGTCHEPTDLDQAYNYSSINEFTTPTKDETVTYSCGIVPEIEINNTDPLVNIGVNETFTAGDFPVTVKQVQGGNGRFSGTGFIVVPYLEGARIAVEFNGIKINTDYQLIDGIVFTDYDKTWGGVDDVGDGLDALQDLLGAFTSLFKEQQELLDAYKEAEDPEVKDSIFTRYNTSVLETDNRLDELLQSEYVTEEEKQELQQVRGIDKIVATNLSDQEVENYKELNTQKADKVKEIAAREAERREEAEEAEEELLYDDKEYINKVFQKMRCAYMNQETTLSPDYFDKTGEDFSAVFEEYGELNLLLKDQSSRLQKLTPTTEEKETGSGNKTNRYTLFTLDYGGIVITAKRYNERSKTEEKLTALQAYLFPKDNQSAREDYNEVLQQLNGKTEYTDADIRELKAIANCGAQYFSVKNKAIALSKIANHSMVLTEYYEDLIFDLIENYQGDVTAYSNEILTELGKDRQLLQRLFNGVDNVDGSIFWKGNEDNFDRFLKVMFGLWQDSKFSNPQDYTYVEDVIGGTTLTPYTIAYDGNSWFPGVSYEQTNFYENHLKINTKTIHGDYGSLEYKYFQPVLIAFENNGSTKITKTEVPAIFFAGTAKKDNLKKSLDQIGLTIDIALTFSGVGNFTKLRHLTKLKQVGRVVLGTVEITSGVADILTRYTDLCEGNQEFCKAFQQYNTYLQLGLLGSGLIRAKFNSVRNNASEEYSKHREALVNKYGENDTKIKELDGHFGVGINKAWGKAGKYGKSVIASKRGFINQLNDLLTKEGLTIDDFHYMMQKTSTALTSSEKAIMNRIRSSIPKPNSTTVMQKVIPKSDMAKYLRKDNPYNNVGGYVTKASDAKHLKSFDDIYHGLRLDYTGTTFFIEDGSCAVIRFTSKNTKSAVIPSGGSYAKYDYPFTAHGFTAGKNGRVGAPEWHLQNRINLDDGAELWEVFSDGTEKLIAMYDETIKKFIEQ